MKRPRFGGIADRPGETESAAELAAMVDRRELTTDVSFYFLYEAADAAVRINNCKLELTILLQMMPEFYQQGTQLRRFYQLFRDQPIPHDQLLLAIPEEPVLQANKATTEIIERYLRNGIRLVLDSYGSLILVIPSESGVFTDIADQCGDYQATLKLTITYSGLTLTCVTSTM